MEFLVDSFITDFRNTLKFFLKERIIITISFDSKMLLKTRMFLVWWLHIKIFVDSPLISDDEEL